ncbi:hypothetical protein [Viridibacillus arvi]|uniref:hypothetical protein n=1 Tax=Viridibacillus arvi TaxID=263475 RepID=UPI0034CD737C
MIVKNKIFPPNEFFEFKTDYPSINRIEDKIRYIELVIKYTRHTVRLHQNKKNLIKLEKELRREIFNSNKLDLFNVISEEIDKSLEKELNEQFNN